VRRGLALVALVAATAALAAGAAHARDPAPSDMKPELAKALAAEAKAKQQLGTRNYAAARATLQQAGSHLGAIVAAVGVGLTQGDLDQGDAQVIHQFAMKAWHEDNVAVAAAKKRNRAAALAALAEAGRLKVQLKKAIDDAASTFGRCEATKEFDVYAVPQGFAGSYADVYPHGVPEDATNIRFSFIDTATGKPPAPQLFPGQTWKATNKGFLPDGRLDIRVDVTGTGFGAQDANKKHWKVVVTYDC
jgi:hypothetical protein